ncbi:PDZ domain-containing protein MAGIX isoform X3 [Gorilla gorilla gorilla]|uniref:PDZ domain-containing protein MAGIX isoform X3 n=1 Tax=Gorilla gorilla gorilla TaxID=9595 RepID=UPI00244652CA|nr:PDZ domain-containing protein MAGIX isoform X3 [Gorilla gorilla gorilla]
MGVGGGRWSALTCPLLRAGRGPSPLAGPSARQLLARLDARPLAARAAVDVAALVRRAGATLRLRRKEAVSVLDSADIEVTDSRLPHATIVDHRPQHRWLETCNAPPQVIQGKARSAPKPSQASGHFSVELVRGYVGFGLTLGGGRDVAGDTPLAVRGLLKDGPAQRCGRLEVGDLVLHINGESTQGLTHAQAVERIRAGGPQLHLVIRRPLETHPGKPRGVGEPRKGVDRSPDPGGPEVTGSRSSSTSLVQHPPSRTTLKKTRGSPEPSPEAAADGPTVSPPERRAEDPNDQIPGSPGPWLMPSEERLSRALGVRGAAQLAQEMAAARRRH